MADSLIEQHMSLEGKVDLNIQQLQSLDKDIRVQAVSHVQEIGSLKLGQEESEKKILEHSVNIENLKKTNEIVQLDVKKLHRKQTSVAARVSDTVQMVKQLSSQHDETKKDTQETIAIVQKVTIETERQLVQLFHKEDITIERVSGLEVKVTEIDDDVQRIKEDVEQIHHKGKTAGNRVCMYFYFSLYRKLYKCMSVRSLLAATIPYPWLLN